MDVSYYRVDTRMIPPIVMSMVLGVFLIILEGSTQRGFLILFLLLPFFYLGLEILSRKITIDSNGIVVSKLFRTVSLPWEEIESLDSFQTGSKLFLILQAAHSGPLIITNTIKSFKDLADRLVERLPEETVTETAREMLQNPPSKHGPLLQAWIVCLVLAGVMVGKILGYG